MRGPSPRHVGPGFARAVFCWGSGKGAGQAGHRAGSPGPARQATMSAMARARTGTVAALSPAMFIRLSLTM